ncbi:TPA: hypothetical protein ACQQYL_006785, partial [Pseudomonas aeruginosa]
MAQSFSAICDCQSGGWKEVSLSISGKEALSGSLSTYMAFTGTDTDGINNYCRFYSVEFSGDGLVIANLKVYGGSTQANYSELVATILVNNKVVAQNYSMAASSGGGFYTSVSSTESVMKGPNTVRLCGGERAITSPGVTFSVSM